MDFKPLRQSFSSNKCIYNSHWVEYFPFNQRHYELKGANTKKKKKKKKTSGLIKAQNYTHIRMPKNYKNTI